MEIKKKTFEKPNGEILENQKPFEKSNKKQNKSNQIAFKSTTILLRTPIAQMIFFNQAYGFCFLTFVVVVCLFFVVVFCLNTCEFTLERFSIAFTANVRLKFPVYQKLVKFIWFQLIFSLLATGMEQVLKTEK